jgi:hypothetical protein
MAVACAGGTLTSSRASTLVHAGRSFHSSGDAEYAVPVLAAPDMSAGASSC